MGSDCYLFWQQAKACDYRCHHHGNSKSGLHLAEPSVPEALRASHPPMGRAAPGPAASPWDSLVEWNGGNWGGAGWVIDGKGEINNNVALGMALGRPNPDHLGCKVFPAK